MKLEIFKLIILSGVLSVLGCGPDLPGDVAEEYARLPQYIDYNFHIKPILSDRCYACHGPDELARKADLRLDLESAAKAKLSSGHYALSGGRLQNSTVYHRIVSTDESYMMPPPESKLELSSREKAMLVKWIRQGAEYKPHWAFIPPEKSSVPEKPEPQWLVHNEIDLFIQKKLKPLGLSPSPPADQEVLLKRLFMDLTGLPPAIKDIDDFLADSDPDAYEKMVDRLLESDEAAERLAMEWMDLARYADSHGLHADGWRNAWPWRDWVIQAFKGNMPYDQFITEQLAGDLLPNPTRDQILATAFHRNHPMTAEGGAIDEEFRLEYVADRTNTTATALMGMTMECARCHDHKFDPISQKDYYAMSAFFNNVRELGMTGDDGNYGPLLQLRSGRTQQEIEKLQTKIEEINQTIKLSQSKIDEIDAMIDPELSIKKGISAHLTFEKKGVTGKGQTMFDGLSNAYSNGNPSLEDGLHGEKCIVFDNEYDEVYLSGIPEMDVQSQASVSLWINTSKRQPTKTQVLIGNAGDKNNYWRGWDFYLEDDNRLSLRLISSLPHNLIHVRSQDSIPLHTWTQVAFTYDGSGHADGARLFINGQLVAMDVIYDRLYKNIRTISSGANEEVHRPLRISKSYRAFTGDNGIFKGKMDEIRVYPRILSNLEIAHLAGLEVGDLKLIKEHLQVHDPKILHLQGERSSLVQKLIAIQDTISEVMVMEEMDVPRPTFVLNRGQYDAPMESVNPATPASILPFDEELPRNRLGLARWLFDARHPLTARATVNRYWQLLFGRGIVETAQDFGNQGALPSHPQLLDWLAVSFQEDRWNVRNLLKLMVMSATYRQSSRSNPRQVEIDPENVFLSRGASYRWPAEMIRDNALAASGLLVRKIGGPSVKPYQPEGLWIEKGTFSHKLLRYIPDTGSNLYRRSLYTFIKRTSPPPTMTIFDVPSRDVCNIRRESTNTPLQALVLLNDPQFVEAARVLGERMLTEAGPGTNEQIQYGFRLVTGRKPTPDELDILRNIFEQSYNEFESDPRKASELLSVGESPRDVKGDLKKQAAMAMIGNTMINMDEAYMKR